MRLKRLWIDGFKNLNDFEIDFNDKEGITVLIGNNGSGKSNVLEAISAIFADFPRSHFPSGNAYCNLWCENICVCTN